MNNATEYINNTSFFVIAKQSDGCTYELNPGMKVKADEGTYFTALKYPSVNNKWVKINVNKIHNSLK